jgi:tetratricopeptide (TPR) repeat protein
MKKPLLLSAIVFAVALTLRLIHIWQIHNSPFFTVLMGDARTYDAWAQRIAAGDWIGRDVFYQAPLYPYFLGVMYWIAGRSLMLVRIAQAVIGSCSCVLVAAAAQRLFSVRAGLVAGLMLAIYAPAIFFDALIQKSVLDVFFVSLVLWLIAGNPRWLPLGLAVGGLILTRENALVFVPVILAWAIFFSVGPTVQFSAVHRFAASSQLAGPPTPLRFGLRPAGLFALGVTLVLLPVVVRNSIAGGGFYLTTSQFGPNFFIGNHAGADGTYQSLRYGRGDPEYERQDATELAEYALHRTLTPAEVSGFWTDNALAFIKSNPVAWLKLMGRKIALLANATEMIDTEDQATYAEESNVLALLGPMTHFGVLVPLAAVGMLAMSVAALYERRRSQTAATARPGILYALLIAYSGSVVLFYVVARYRYPLVPILIMFAAPGVFAITRARIVTIAAIAIVVNWPMGSANAMRAVTETNLGAALQNEHRRDDAILHYRRAIAMDPGYAPAYSNLGMALREENRIDEASESYREALKLQPEFATANYNFANLLLDQRDPAAAIPHFERAMQKEPPSADVHNNFAIALAATGRTDEALREFHRAIDLDPASARAYRNLGDTLASQSRWPDAIAALRKAVELDSGNADLHYDLASALLESGNLDEAVTEFRATLRIAPAMVDAHNNLGIALGSQGKLDEAIREFRRVLAIQPGFASAQQNLTMALAALRARGK